MECDCYFYPSNKGEVIIRPNDEYPSRWDLWIDDKLICPAYYRSPEEAALRAHQRDFGDKQLNEMYVGLRVPSVLSRWRSAQAFKKGVPSYD